MLAGVCHATPCCFVGFADEMSAKKGVSRQRERQEGRKVTASCQATRGQCVWSRVLCGGQAGRHGQVRRLRHAWQAGMARMPQVVAQQVVKRVGVKGWQQVWGGRV